MAAGPPASTVAPESASGEHFLRQAGAGSRSESLILIHSRDCFLSQAAVCLLPDFATQPLQVFSKLI